MKKAIALFSAAIVFTFLIPAAFAETGYVRYSLEELDMSLEIPDKMNVITRDFVKDKQALADEGMDAEWFQNSFLVENFYFLNAIMSDSGGEITVSMIEDDTLKEVWNVSLYENHELHEFSDMVEELYTESGITYTAKPIRRTQAAVFATGDAQRLTDGDMEYGRISNTIINGQYIAIAIWSHGVPLSAEQDLMYEHILDSIEFTQILERPASTAMTANYYDRYSLEELYLSLEIPGDTNVITRDFVKGEQALTDAGMDVAWLQETFFTENHGYLNAIPSDASGEITVVMVESDGSKGVWNLNLYDDSEIQPIYDAMIEEFPKQGIAYTAKPIYRTQAATFLMGEVQRVVNETTAYGRLGFTTVNGQSITIGLWSYRGPVTVEQESAHKHIIDSIEFTQILEKPIVPEDPANKFANMVADAVKFGLICGVIGGILGGIYHLIQRRDKNTPI